MTKQPDGTADRVHKQLIADVSVLAERRVKFTVTTDTPDRERDVVSPAGIEFANFERNPTIQWAHDYRSLPVGRAVEILKSGNGIQMVIEFATAELNPMADTVFRMVKAGFLRACSIGFRPLEWAYDETRKGINYVSIELLEVSIVPVPANPDALVSMGAEDLALIKGWAEQALDLALDAETDGGVTKGVSPKDVARSIDDDEQVPWSSPVLKDFTEVGWDELTRGEKRRIAGHYAWASEMPPAAFASLKLPHHSPATGRVVWRGLVSAAARIGRAQIPDEDLDGVKAHLARHYMKFRDEEALPDSLKAAPWEADAVGWAAYSKAAARAERKAGRDLTDAELAGLLDDYGFEAEAGVLRAGVVEEPAAPEAPAVEDEAPRDQQLAEVMAAVRALTDTVAELRSAITVRTEDFGAGTPVMLHGRVDVVPVDSEQADGDVLLLAEDGTDEVVMFLEDDGAETRAAEEAERRWDVDAELLAVSVRESLTELVQRETRTALNALRGRID